jgi:hypothetical protein
MRVLLIGNHESDGQESMQRFAAFMAQGLRQAGHEARVVKPRASLGQLHISGEGFGKWLGYVDKFGLFPLVLKSEIKWADVVHICDHSNSLYTKSVLSGRRRWESSQSIEGEWISGDLSFFRFKLR